jgi:hypothetical protein
MKIDRTWERLVIEHTVVGVHTWSKVSLFKAAYIESRLPESVAGPDEVVEISGSKRSRANSRSDASQSGVSVAMCGLSTSTKYFCSALAICNSAHAEKIAIFTMTKALELSPFRSPMAALSDSANQWSVNNSTRRVADHLLEKFSNAETSNFRILPIRSTSVTMPVAMKVAQTLTA